MTEHPKILFVNVSDASGGAARAAYRIHKAVNKAGGNSRMLVKQKMLADDSVISIEEFDKKYFFTDAYRFVEKKLKNQLQHRRWNRYPDREDVFLSDLRSTSLHGAFQKIDFDILHLHWINLHFMDLQELRKINRPVVWTLHDCWPFTGICHYFYECPRYTSQCGNCPFLHSGKENDLSRKIWQKKKQFYQNVDLHIVSPSRWLAEAAGASSLLGDFPITVIPNPIDIQLFSPADREQACQLLKLNPAKKFILFGAMNALRDNRKGFKEFISAMQYFEKNFEEPEIELIIFGVSNELEKMDIKMPVHSYSVLCDEMLVAAYRAASVMVVPSLSENLSNVIMESLSCGTPVVAFNTGGNADLIDHQNNGYLAKPFSTEDLAFGIHWCLQNNRVNNLSVHARKKVANNFSEEKVAQQYLNLYQSITLKKP
ncbi:MAG: glycosyltransferase family 4 protein [Paludibacteraceae bacterium]|nr:glycosyltransferase family 4 protein [Paludibacteraceae bacterium]